MRGVKTWWTNAKDANGWRRILKEAEDLNWVLVLMIMLVIPAFQE